MAGTDYTTIRISSMFGDINMVIFERGDEDYDYSHLKFIFNE